MKALRLLVAAVAMLPGLTGAQQPDSIRFGFGAFVDVYYAFDLGRPRNFDRRFTTTAARHSEFNVNLAYLETRVTGPRVRGRFALQGGTSVQANYAAEPRLGEVSGPDLSRIVQEAFVGYQVGQGLWVDAGIYLAPFGMESWISSDNATYTRSLIADYAPYYAAGVRTTWQASRVGAQVHLMNGWQNVSESNSDKAVALRFDYSPSGDVDVSYVGFIGNEEPDTARAADRVLHEVIAKYRIGSRVEIAGGFDYGMERGRRAWHGFTTLVRYRVDSVVSLTGRVESFSDPDQVVAITGRADGLRAAGGSITIDVRATSGFYWRLEARALQAREPHFMRGNASLGRGNVVLVSSASYRAFR